MTSTITDQTHRPLSPLSALPSSAFDGPTAEVLWGERRVEHFGTLTRIEVPVLGDPSTLPSAVMLSRELERRWVDRGSLGTGARCTSVVVELVRDLGSARLVLLVGGAPLALEQMPLSVAMARDLRAAIRRCGQGYARMTPQMRVIAGYAA